MIILGLEKPSFWWFIGLRNHPPCIMGFYDVDWRITGDFREKHQLPPSRKEMTYFCNQKRYPFVSSNHGSGKSPSMEGFVGKSPINGPFSVARFDYHRVYNSATKTAMISIFSIFWRVLLNCYILWNSFKAGSTTSSPLNSRFGHFGKWSTTILSVGI